LLAGHSPRWAGPGAPTPAQIASRRGEPIEPIPDVAPELMDALLAALADDPADRPSAEAFRDRLTAAGRTVSADRAVGAAPVLRRAGRDRGWVMLLAVAIIVLGVVAAWLVGGPDRNSGAAEPPLVPPRSAGTAAPTRTVTPTPTPTPLPAGFVDCTDRVGAPALCPKTPECWTGVYSYMDSPYVAVAQDCDKPHVYQTYAAVQLTSTPRRQSRIDSDKAVKAACNRRALNRLMVGTTADRTWELMVIPPQFKTDTVYRCISGKETRTGSLRLTGPE
jgi:hypothetical protein